MASQRITKRQKGETTKKNKELVKDRHVLRLNTNRSLHGLLGRNISLGSLDSHRSSSNINIRRLLRIENIIVVVVVAGPIQTPISLIIVAVAAIIEHGPDEVHGDSGEGPTGGTEEEGGKNIENIDAAIEGATESGAARDRAGRAVLSEEEARVGQGDGVLGGLVGKEEGVGFGVEEAEVGDEGEESGVVVVVVRVGVVVRVEGLEGEGVGGD
ncbi:hypothetical protein Drorol1_Dr00022954 [Drosera rotundifolia]